MTTSSDFKNKALNRPFKATEEMGAFAEGHPVFFVFAGRRYVAVPHGAVGLRIHKTTSSGAILAGHIRKPPPSLTRAALSTVCATSKNAKPAVRIDRGLASK
jgi:hypothetical protein